MIKNFIVFSSLFFSLQLFSQQYTPLLDYHNEWHFTTCYFGCLTDIYYTDGDTLVNGENHKILDGFHYISRTFLLRENTTEKKVYLSIVKPTKIDEYLLYDFSLNEGDSMLMLNPISPYPDYGGYFYVDSIRTKTLVDGNNYKHFYFSPSPYNTIMNTSPIWIEGVGSLSLINAPGGTPDINDVGTLSCFFKHSELTYQNLDSISFCTPNLSEIEENNKQSPPKIKTLVPFEKYQLSSTSSIGSHQILNSKGQVIYHAEYEIPHQFITVDLSPYENGMFFIHITDEDHYTQRIKLIHNGF